MDRSHLNGSLRHYELEEAALILGKTAPFLRKQINEGRIAGFKAQRGQPDVWAISPETLERLRSDVRSVG